VLRKNLKNQPLVAASWSKFRIASFAILDANMMCSFTLSTPTRWSFEVGQYLTSSDWVSEEICWPKSDNEPEVISSPFVIPNRPAQALSSTDFPDPEDPSTAVIPPATVYLSALDQAARDIDNKREITQSKNKNIRFGR
jgi:hypothetical protein